MAELSKLDEAAARFDAALRRLEAVVARAQENGGGRASDEDAVFEDREQLAQEVSDMRAKANELAERNRNAASKIDSAMAKIKLVLG
jgi:hypothetical protein